MAIMYLLYIRFGMAGDWWSLSTKIEFLWNTFPMVVDTFMQILLQFRYSLQLFLYINLLFFFIRFYCAKHQTNNNNNKKRKTERKYIAQSHFNMVCRLSLCVLVVCMSFAALLISLANVANGIKYKSLFFVPSTHYWMGWVSHTNKTENRFFSTTFRMAPCNGLVHGAFVMGDHNLMDLMDSMMMIITWLDVSVQAH